MIITHTSPDWDAITSCWLLQRHGGLEEHEVVFVNTGNPDRALLDAAAAVVDTGREYDVTRWRFDHHQLPGAEANATCAAHLVWRWLESRASIPSAEYDALMGIEDLIRLIFSGDTGRREYGADWSRSVGIHALLSAQKAKRLSDADLLAYGYQILDDLAAHLLARRQARATLDAHTVYTSDDGMVRGLSGAPQGATFAAFEAGARLVVFHSEAPATVSAGVMRGGEGDEPHCGALVKELLQDYDCNIPSVTPDVYDELTRWFRHPAGFFAGRGTAKAPDPRPLAVSVAEIAAAIDGVWRR